MIINRKKSGIIIHQQARGASTKMTEKDIKGIPIVKQYKYLGIIIDERLNFQQNTDNIKQKTKKAMKMINIMQW